MKCNNCGQEFGPGLTCQHCGIDRVAGLADFSDGSIPKGGSNSPNTSYSSSVSGQILCWNCGEIIPSNSKFCPFCGKEVAHKCPNCGHNFPAQFAHCPECGTNYEQFFKKAEEERIKREERRPKILSLTYQKWENSTDRGFKIVWNCKNTSRCKILLKKRSSNNWWLFSSFDKLPNSGSVIIDSDKIYNLLGFFTREADVDVELTAYSDTEDWDQEQIKVHVYWPAFGALSIS